MDTLVPLAFLLVALVGLVSIAVPLKRLRIRTRARGALVAAGGLALFVTSVLVLAPPKVTVPPTASGYVSSGTRQAPAAAPQPVGPPAAAPQSRVTPSPGASQATSLSAVAPPPPAPVVLLDVSKADVRAIQSVERTDIFSEQNNKPIAHPNGRLTVTFKMADNFTLNMVMIGATQVIFDAAQFQIKHGRPFYVMSFVVEGDVVDKYGKESVAKDFEIEFQQSDLNRVVWDNMNNFKLLNLASSVSIFNVAGRQVIGAFCKEQADEDGAFCSNAGTW